MFARYPRRNNDIDDDDFREMPYRAPSIQPEVSGSDVILFIKKYRQTEIKKCHFDRLDKRVCQIAHIVQSHRWSYKYVIHNFVLSSHLNSNRTYMLIENIIFHFNK